MRFHQLNTLLGIAVLGAFFSGCISVNLSKDGDYKSTSDVAYEAPPPPFKEVVAPKADHAWSSPSTGNTITYLSECGYVGHLQISEVATTVMLSQGLKIKSQNKTQINGVTAIESEGFQSAGSQTVLVTVVTFKTKKCLYNLAYLGTDKNFEKNEADFARFKESFRGP